MGWDRAPQADVRSASGHDIGHGGILGKNERQGAWPETGRQLFCTYWPESRQSSHLAGVSHVHNDGISTGTTFRFEDASDSGGVRQLAPGHTRSRSGSLPARRGEEVPPLP